MVYVSRKVRYANPTGHQLLMRPACSVPDAEAKPQARA